MPFDLYTTHRKGIVLMYYTTSCMQLKITFIYIVEDVDLRSNVKTKFFGFDKIVMGKYISCAGQVHH